MFEERLGGVEKQGLQPDRTKQGVHRRAHHRIIVDDDDRHVVQRGEEPVNEDPQVPRERVRGQARLVVRAQRERSLEVPVEAEPDRGAPLRYVGLITRAIAFSIEYWATLPAPETLTRRPSKLRPCCLSICLAK